MKATKRICVKLSITIQADQETIDTIINQNDKTNLFINHPAVVECLVESIQDINPDGRTIN